MEDEFIERLDMCPCCFEYGDNCKCSGQERCTSCGKMFCKDNLYEYRGIISCTDCHGK